MSKCPCFSLQKLHVYLVVCVCSPGCVYTCVLDLCDKLFTPAFSSDTGHGVQAKLLQPQTTPTALWELPIMPE